MLYALLAGAILLAAAWLQNDVSSKAQTERDINEFIVRQTHGLERESAEVKDFRSNLTTLLARQRVIETLRSNVVPTAEVLADLTLLPRTVALENIRIQGRDLSVRGAAASKEETWKAVSALDASRVIRNPDFIFSRSQSASGAERPPRQAFTLVARLAQPGSRSGAGTRGGEPRK